jgi:hypothetical protein
MNTSSYLCMLLSALSALLCSALLCSDQHNSIPSLMAAVFQALILDPLQFSDIDHNIFQYWLNGVNASELTQYIKYQLNNNYFNLDNSNQYYNNNNSAQANPSAVAAPVELNQAQLINNSKSKSLNNSPAAPVVYDSVSNSSSSDDSDNEEVPPSPAAAANNSTILSQAYQRLYISAQDDLINQYRVFSYLEHYFRRPALFDVQYNSLIQLSHYQAIQLIQLYYNFDIKFIRLLIGLKFSSKTRSQMLDFAGRSGVKIKINSANRQFDNVRRLYRARWPDNEAYNNNNTSAANNLVSTVNANINKSRQRWKGKLDNSINSLLEEEATVDLGENELYNTTNYSCPAQFYSSQFHLSESLARQYAVLIFLSRYRFDSHNKKLSACNYYDWLNFGAILMKTWTVKQNKSNEENVVIEWNNLNNATNTTTLANLVLSSPRSHEASISKDLSSPPNNSIKSLFDRNVSELDPEQPELAEWNAELLDELDLSFLLQLKEIKFLLLDNRKLLDEYNVVIIKYLRDQCTENGRVRPTALNKLQPRLLSLLKAMMNIASNLPKNKKIRSLFNDISELIVKPLSKLGFLAKEFAALFLAVSAAFKGLSSVELSNSSPKVYWNWLRYLDALGPIAIGLYIRTSEIQH